MGTSCPDARFVDEVTKTIGSHFITYEFTNANPTESSTSGDAQP
jgi:hypothetical protein